MKRKRFSVEQIASVLQRVTGGMAVGDVCRQVGKLKRLVADLSFDKPCCKTSR